MLPGWVTEDAPGLTFRADANKSWVNKQNPSSSQWAQHGSLPEDDPAVPGQGVSSTCQVVGWAEASRKPQAPPLLWGGPGSPLQPVTGPQLKPPAKSPFQTMMSLSCCPQDPSRARQQPATPAETTARARPPAEGQWSRGTTAERKRPSDTGQNYQRKTVYFQVSVEMLQWSLKRKNN